MSSSLGEGEQKSESGIYSGHAYSLIGAFDFKVGEKRVKLVKLRNPWGHGEWKGDWSDCSPLWTPELRKTFNV